MNNFIIPPIGTSGIFTFLPPFDKLINARQEFKVLSIRDLTELENSDEKPFNTIYVPVGLTDKDFKDDVDNKVPIIVLTSKSGEYIYIPADRIASMPKIEGVKFQDKTLVVNLGGLPVDYDLTLLKDVLENDIYDVLGIKTNVTHIATSGIYYVTQEEAKTLEQLMANGKTIDKSYKTKYLETLTLLRDRDTLIEKLTTCIKENNCV